MHDTVSCVFGIFETGDHTEDSLLFRPLESCLESYEIVHGALAVILTKLQAGIRLAFCLRIDKSDRL